MAGRAIAVVLAVMALTGCVQKGAVEIHLDVDLDDVRGVTLAQEQQKDTQQ